MKLKTFIMISFMMIFLFSGLNVCVWLLNQASTVANYAGFILIALVATFFMPAFVANSIGAMLDSIVKFKNDAEESSKF